MLHWSSVMIGLTYKFYRNLNKEKNKDLKIKIANKDFEDKEELNKILSIYYYYYQRNKKEP